MTEKRRVAITGLGVISPVGIGQAAYWQGLLAPQPTDECRAHDFESAVHFDACQPIEQLGREEIGIELHPIDARLGQGEPASNDDHGFLIREFELWAAHGQAGNGKGPVLSAA